MDQSELTPGVTTLLTALKSDCEATLQLAEGAITAANGGHLRDEHLAGVRDSAAAALANVSGALGVPSGIEPIEPGNAGTAAGEAAVALQGQAIEDGFDEVRQDAGSGKGDGTDPTVSGKSAASGSGSK